MNKVPIMTMMVEMIIRTVIMIMMGTKITKKLTNVMTFEYELTNFWDYLIGGKKANKF